MNFSVDCILNDLKPKRASPILQAHRETRNASADAIAGHGIPELDILDPRPVQDRQTRVKLLF